MDLFEPTAARELVQTIFAMDAPSPEGLKTSEIMGIIKVGAIVILLAFMNGLKNSRQWGRVPRRPQRDRNKRSSSSLNTRRSPGSKPEGGAT